MTKPNFKAMSKQELRAYVLQYPEDNEAFYELSDRIRANARPVTLEQLEQILRTQSKHQK